MRGYDPLIHDIVKSKGYQTYLDWCYGKKTVSDFVDSLNTKIANGKKKDKLLKSEIVDDDFQQLEFKF